MYSIIMVPLEVILHKSNSGILESLSLSWQIVFDYKLMFHRTPNFGSILECFQILFWSLHIFFNNLSQ